MGIINNAQSNGLLLRECGWEVIEIIKQLGLTPEYVFNAVEQYHLKTMSVEDILKICGHPLVRARDAHGNTPLHYAAEGGYTSICKYLLEQGANIDEQNSNGETP